MGKLNREDAVSLLKEIMATCGSLATAQAVAITMDKETKSYVLSVNWVPEAYENECLTKILAKHGLEAVIVNGRTVFRSKKAS